jgi:hypothetical protein
LDGVTREQLSALPERNAYVLETLPTGETVRHRIEPKFIARKIRPDDIFLFHDENGSWTVEYHLEGGPYRRRIWL